MAKSTFRWPSGLRLRSKAACLLKLRVRIPPEDMGVLVLYLLCCVGNGLCDELITIPEESYTVCLTVCNLETSAMSWPRPDSGCSAANKNYCYNSVSAYRI